MDYFTYVYNCPFATDECDIYGMACYTCCYFDGEDEEDDDYYDED